MVAHTGTMFFTFLPSMVAIAFGVASGLLSVISIAYNAASPGVRAGYSLTYCLHRRQV